MHKKILVVDDDKSTLKFLSDFLSGNGYAVSTACDGNSAIQAVEDGNPNLVLLDIMLPGMDGYAVCEKLRSWSSVPIIMLSALREVRDKVRCLELGADDYISKPFSLEELLARINAVQRRYPQHPSHKATPARFVRGDLSIDFSEHKVTCNKMVLSLTSTEYALLCELALNSPQVLTYQLLLQRVWGPEYGNEKDYLYVYIRRLRKLLEPDPQNPQHIISLREVGYQLV